MVETHMTNYQDKGVGFLSKKGNARDTDTWFVLTRLGSVA